MFRRESAELCNVVFVSEQNEYKGKGYFNYLIDQAYIFFYKKKCNEITMWLNGSIKLQKAIKTKGFKVQSSRKMVCKFDLKNKNYKKTLNPNKWYFTMGDTFEIF